MTKTAKEALDYFNKVTTEKPLDPDVQSALKLYTDLTSKWAKLGFDFSFESAGYASIILFKKWHMSGMRGGIKKYRSGLHRCLRWSMCRVVPKSTQTVSGVDPEGQPHFRVLRGKPATLTRLEAVALASRWNQEAKDSRSCYRFSYFRNVARWGSDAYKIRRYRIAFEFPPTVSLDAFDYDVLGTDDDGELSGFATQCCDDDIYYDSHT